MSAAVVLVGKPAAESLTALESRLREWGFALHCAPQVSALPALVRRSAPIAVLADISAGLRPDDVRRALPADEPPIIALNPAGVPGRLAAIAAGCSVVLDYPLDWAELKACLYTPRGANGRLLTAGPLFGRTQMEASGTADLLAHDLKSPISLIISSLEVLMSIYDCDGAAAEDVMRLLQGSLYAAYRQMYMVSDLIDLTRLELGSFPLDLEPLDASALVSRCVEAERRVLEAKGLVVAVELPDEPLPVRADRELLQRAVRAILDNTLKFTVRGDTLAVAALRIGDSVNLRFADSGRPIQRGFEQDIMRRAPHWDGRQSGTRTSVAMGLPFACAVAQAHGGSLKAASDLSTGLTTFDFILPLSQQSEMP
ncbi:MAG: sensor histidine kinase [Aggregatilineales bacterium]